jgi:hypothetical protein
MMDFGIKDGMFKIKVFNRYGAFDWITIESMKDLGYTNLHCEICWTWQLWPQSFWLWNCFIQKCMNNICKRACLWGSKTLAFNQNPKGDWERWHTHCHYNSINNYCVINFWIPTWIGSYLFHLDSIREFKSFIEGWRFTIIIGVRGKKDNKGGKQLMIVMEKVNLNAQHYIIFTKVIDVTIRTYHHGRPIYLNMLTNKYL